MKKKLKIFGCFLLFQIIFVPILMILLVFYGPFQSTREMIVTTAMTTMSHQYFATWFLSNEQIEEILAKNRPDENIGEQDIGEIVISENVNDGIELIDVSVKTSVKNFNGYLLVINDPSRVKLVTAPRLGVVGSTTSQIVEEYDAIGGINAGGFADDSVGTGGKPIGVIIQDGELKYIDNQYNSYKIVGIDDENRMVVSTSMTYAKMKSLKLMSAVSFGPVLVMNGYGTIKEGSDGGGGLHPRTAIGQRKDGTILMLVIDGRQAGGSLGATLKDVQDILLEYGAYNAFNLDGGASSTMIFNNKLINRPSDIMGERYVPTAFIITKSK